MSIRHLPRTSVPSPRLVELLTEHQAANDAICQPFERRTVVLFAVFLAVLAVGLLLKGGFA